MIIGRATTHTAHLPLVFLSDPFGLAWSRLNQVLLVWLEKNVINLGSLDEPGADSRHARGDDGSL